MGKRSRPSDAAAKETPDADAVVETLRKMGTKAVRDGMARYAIPSDKAFGVSVGELKKLSKTLGRSHDLALGLWKSGVYEARMLAAFVDEPDKVTPSQMDAWRRDFDNWAVCDHACFHLFDKTPHAWKKVQQWASLKNEFEKRAAFALMASLALHDKKAPDEPFAEAMELIEREASDGRNFVKKAVNWALRAIGKRNPAMRSAAIALAEKLAASDDPTSRWNGKDALRELKGASAKRSSR
jgi:3-methyladenine DNA glycosylase AlkD